MRPKVAVVIVNWNAGDWLSKSVQSVLRQTLPADRIVVVDNASTDGSLAALGETRASNVEIIRLKNIVGFAAANNVGIERAEDCEWIALLNPDAVADSRWLEMLLKNAERHVDYQFFACRQVMANDPKFLDGAGDVYHVSGLHWRHGYGESVDQAEDAREVFSPCGAAALFRADVLREAGGFDESFFCYAEDIDLAISDFACV